MLRLAIAIVNRVDLQLQHRNVRCVGWNSDIAGIRCETGPRRHAGDRRRTRQGHKLGATALAHIDRRKDGTVGIKKLETHLVRVTGS